MLMLEMPAQINLSWHSQAATQAVEAKIDRLAVLLEVNQSAEGQDVPEGRWDVNGVCRGILIEGATKAEDDMLLKPTHLGKVPGAMTAFALPLGRIPCLVPLMHDQSVLA